MLMYNFLGYSLNYSDTTGSLSIYSKNEPTNFNADIGDVVFKSLMYKAKLVGETDAQPAPNNKKILKNAIIAVPKKYLSNFWRSLEMWLINCKVELKLKWTKHCVLATAGVTMLILILIISFLLSKT